MHAGSLQRPVFNNLSGSELGDCVFRIFSLVLTTKIPLRNQIIERHNSKLSFRFSVKG
jgi:hypothetical protein